MIFETTATLEIDGDESDVPVRAEVSLEMGAGVGGNCGAVVGDIEACVNGAWVDVDMLDVDARMRERLEESFSDIAFADAGYRDE